MPARNNQHPRISVIVPTRNRPKQFEIALRSIRAQSLADLEIIAIEDGSDPEHRNAYGDLAATFDVTLLQLPQTPSGHGASYARNQGISHSRGDYVSFLDDDDWWVDSDYLSRAVSHLDQSNADVYFASQLAVFSDGATATDVWLEALPSLFPRQDPRRNQAVFNVSAEELIAIDRFCHLNTTILRKHLLDDLGGFDEQLRYEEDRDLYLRLLDTRPTFIFDTNIVAQHNIPDTKAPSSASTRETQREKLLYQLMSADKLLCQARKPALRKKASLRKGYILRHLSEMERKQKHHAMALAYGINALRAHFGFKWAVHCLHLGGMAILQKGREANAK